MSKNIQVPQGWEVKKLGEVVEINNTRVLSEQLEPLSISAGIGFVNQTEKFGRDLAGKQYEKYIKIKKYDFAYNKGNSKKYPQGCIYLLKDREHAAIPNVFECFRIKNYNCFYYEQLFISGFLNKQLYRLINAGVRNDGLLNLNSENFYSCYIPVPPLEEQKKIAEILSLWDKAIEQTKELIAYKEKQKKGLMQALLTGKKRLNGFTDEWKTYQLGEIFQITSAGVDKKILEDEIKVHLLNYMDIYNNNIINNGTTNFITTASKNKILNCNILKGDVFLTPSSETREDIAHSAVATEDLINTVYSYHIMRLRPKIQINILFSKYMFDNDYFRQQVYSLCDGSGQRYVLSINIVKNLELIIPTSVDEQKAIADILSSADEEIELLNKQLELYTEQKKGLMQNLLTGKVRV